MGTWSSKPPDEDTDPKGFAAWRHEFQLPVMHALFPRAAAQLPDCPVCGQDAAGHQS